MIRRSRTPSGRWAFSQRRVKLGVLAFTLLVLSGCSQRSSTTGVAFAVNQPELEGQAVTVPGSMGWVDTEIDVSDGEPVSVTASGRVIVRQSDKWGQKFEASVGPAGTFLVHDGIQDQKFPLPSGSRGPAPCFCLMGRIGEGPAFFVGQSRSWTATASGRLQLAVNDFDPSDSEGAFHAQVTLPKQIQPVAYEEVVPAHAENGRPFALSQVVVFYVDGLRPDVVREMAAMGHLPNIKTLFLDNGVWLSNCFTGFPSDTITSNGTMWTGCFSDRHGLKGQVRFSRHRLVSESYLDPLGPSRSARMLAPQGVDRALIDGQSTIQRWVQGNDAGEIWRQSLTSDIAPLYEILRREGQDWATGMLPVMTEMPPPLWSRSLARSVPYFHAQEAWRYIDDANTNYTVRRLIPRDQPVMIVWLPETDSVSHKECRGQFGATRRTIAKADQLIGQIIAEFRAHDRLRTTYFCLVSDHGHHGGRTGHLSLFDVAHEALYRPREISTDGQWIGGGLGLSVRQHREWARHTGDSGRQFVFVDGDSDGAARLYFPKGHYRSGDWSGPSRPSDLLAYRIADHLPPINLVDMLSRAEFRIPDGQQQEQLMTQAANPPGAPRNLLPPDSREASPTPIDLVLMKLTDQSLLVASADRGWAVIERRAATRPAAGAIRWQLRYSVVSDVEPTPDGHVAYQVVERPLRDPLKLTQLADQDFLRDFHDEAEWLEVQTDSEYPDSVVAFSRHMLWQENLKLQESDAAPDLVITAKSGWYFGNNSSAGTTHGHPLADAMRASWFVSGPNIRRGARIDAPCRLVDLTPTILDMIGSRANRDHFDGRAIRTIYQPETTQAPLALGPQQQPRDERLPFARGPYSRQTLHTPNPPGIARLNANGDVTLTSGQVMKAIYWDSVDLQAWRPVSYQPVPEYPHQPLTINHPASPFDLNNMTYNALLFTELSVFRILDDAISPVSRGRRPIMSAADQVDLALRHSQNEWISESANVFDLTNINLWDYQLTSQTNMRRMDAAVDYVQRREQSLEEEIANATGQQRLPGSKLVHGTIDMTQYGFWSVYGFGQRLIMQVLDETLIQGLENTTDRALNAARPMPAEVLVPAGAR